jgi:hypothetical protein
VAASQQHAQELVAKLANDVIDDMARKMRIMRESMPIEKQIEIELYQAAGLETEAMYCFYDAVNWDEYRALE